MVALAEPATLSRCAVTAGDTDAPVRGSLKKALRDRAAGLVGLPGDLSRDHLASSAGSSPDATSGAVSAAPSASILAVVDAVERRSRRDRRCGLDEASRR